MQSFPFPGPGEAYRLSLMSINLNHMSYDNHHNNILLRLPI